MAVNHRKLRLVVAGAVGILAAWYAYQWGTDAERPRQRAQEEAVVLASREILLSYIRGTDVEVSDALQRNKDAGKVYIYPTSDGWELSGHYRRSSEKAWHDFLISLQVDSTLKQLSVNDDDAGLVALAETDPRFSASSN